MKPIFFSSSVIKNNLVLNIENIFVLIFLLLKKFFLFSVFKINFCYLSCTEEINIRVVYSFEIEYFQFWEDNW